MVNHMSEWSSGYNVDIGYTYGYQRELSPTWLDYVATLHSLSAPTGEWRYLELGCGQGLSILLTAALHPTHEFLGIDFNPQHIAHAQSLAAAAGLTNVRFEEADFFDLADNWASEWGKFNYITAHGIYTWISEAGQSALRGTIEKASSPGALIYLSYNTMPGWISTLPVQHLMRLWQKSTNAQSVPAINSGLERIKALRDSGAFMFKALPGITSRINKMEKENSIYLVHEYLHDHWTPLWFDQLANDLQSVKMSYVGTARVGDFYCEDILPPKQKEQLAQTKDSTVREVMLDVLANQSFRKDVFSRGAVPLQAVSRSRELQQTTFNLLKTPDDTEIKFKISIGDVLGKREVYRPLIDALEDGPKSLAQLTSISSPTECTFDGTLQAMTMLLHGGMVGLHYVPPDNNPAKALNKAICKAASEGSPYRHLVSPQTGSVIPCNEVDMIMLTKVTEDQRLPSPDQLAETLLDCLVTLNKTLMKEGKHLTEDHAMRSQALSLATVFLDESLPKFRLQGVV